MEDLDRVRVQLIKRGFLEAGVRVLSLIVLLRPSVLDGAPRFLLSGRIGRH